jgi:hypothetical protein
LIYPWFGVAWITLSDKFLGAPVQDQDPRRLVMLALPKGRVFMVLSGPPRLEYCRRRDGSYRWKHDGLRLIRDSESWTLELGG